MNHSELCARARQWLRTSRKCNPVFSDIASCAEIPDAIGWSSCYRWYGSTVIECKASSGDFYADLKKRRIYEHPQYGWKYSARRISRKEAKENGYIESEIPCMGDFRYYLCQSGVISEKMVLDHAPDHGLLHIEGRRIRTIRIAPERSLVAKDAEIRYLRFAIINRKTKFECEQEPIAAEQLSFIPA